MPDRLLLLTGIPCTGKSEMGRWLEEHHGFVHVDVEQLIGRPGRTTHRQILEVVAQQSAGGKDMVVTWGFMPGQDDAAIRALQRSGIRMVWLDGDRGVARRFFIERGDPPVRYFDAQIERISKMHLADFSPVILDPFDEQGRRVKQERLAEMLLAAAAERREDRGTPQS